MITKKIEFIIFFTYLYVTSFFALIGLIIGAIIGILDLIKIMHSETHQSRIDWYTNTIIVMDWALPSEIRVLLI